MIQPLFFYCNNAFTGMSNTWKCKFESLQRKAKVVINSTKCNDWPSIHTQRRWKIVLDVFNCLRNDQDQKKYEFITHRYNTRNESTLRIPKVDREVGRKQSHFVGALAFNQLPLKARKEESYVKFKNFLCDFE